jgi:hypothetical protein
MLTSDNFSVSSGSLRIEQILQILGLKHQAFPTLHLAPHLVHGTNDPKPTTMCFGGDVEKHLWQRRKRVHFGRRAPESPGSYEKYHQREHLAAIS